MNAYSKIENHTVQAIKRLTSQYEQAVNFKSVISVQASRMQGVEDVLYDILTKRWIQTAEGVQLEQLGELVGVRRTASAEYTDDAVYRQAIILQISLNRSGGEPEKFYEFFDSLFDVDIAFYIEYGLGSFYLFIKVNSGYTDVLETSLRTQLKNLIPAGVTLYLVDAAQTKPFSTEELNTTPAGFYDGLGELNYSSSAGTFAELLII